MTDYVKSTNFASKDSLASGNPLKIVKGTEIDTEFNNIATAVATKADISSLGTISSQNANNVNVTGGSVTGLSSLTTSGAATIGGYLYTGAVISTSSGAFVSPNATTSGAVVLQDYAGNPDAVYLQATNNARTVQYGYLKFNNNGTLTPSGTINGNISGNAATATNATNATNATDSTNGLIRGSYGNYSGSRSLGVTYTNSTGKMLWVAVAWVHTGTGEYYAYVNGNFAYYTNQDLYPRANVNLLVPPGGTYVVYSAAGDTFLYWFELR